MKLKSGINNLVACGCSFTAGQGLQYAHEAWPFLLARSLNLSCTNLGVPGSGNDLAVARIIDYFSNFPEKKQTTLVVIALTSSHRIEFLEKNGTRPMYTIPRGTSDPAFCKMIFEERYDSLFYYYKYLRTIILLQELFKSYQTSYIFANALMQPHQDHQDDDHVKKLKDQIDMTKFYEFDKHFYNWIDPQKVQKDGHPNEAANIEIANTLKDFILSRYGENI